MREILHFLGGQRFVVQMVVFMVREIQPFSERQKIQLESNQHEFDKKSV